MSAENGDLNWTEILRQAGGPQNLSPIATAQVFLLSAMLREERKRMETSNGSNGAINSVPHTRLAEVRLVHGAAAGLRGCDQLGRTDEGGGDGALTADTCLRLSVENTNSPPRHSWPSKEEANQITQ
jgi:hypothetical protein